MNRNSDVKECFITGSSAQVSRKWDKARPLAAKRTAMAELNFAGDNVAHCRQQSKTQCAKENCRHLHNTSRCLRKAVQTDTKYTGRHEFPP